jgi:hypothetical protein
MWMPCQPDIADSGGDGHKAGTEYQAGRSERDQPSDKRHEQRHGT